MINATKPTGEKCYEYILCYVDDLLCISHDPNKSMNDIQSTLKIKNKKVEMTDFYIGENLKNKGLGGKEFCTMPSTNDIKSAVGNVEEQLKKKVDGLPSRAVTPMSQG